MRGGWFKVYALAYLLFLYAPIILLPLFAFNDATVIAFPLSGFSTKWFAALADDPPLHIAVKNSLIIAVTTAILSTTLAVFAARASTRYRFPGKAGLMGLIMLPLVLPEIIVAVSLLAGTPFGLLMFGALQFAPASHAAVFPFASMSVMGMVLGAWALGDAFTRRKALGVAMVLSGLVVLSGVDASSFTARSSAAVPAFSRPATMRSSPFSSSSSARFSSRILPAAPSRSAGSTSSQRTVRAAGAASPFAASGAKSKPSALNAVALPASFVPSRRRTRSDAGFLSGCMAGAGSPDAGAGVSSPREAKAAGAVVVTQATATRRTRKRTRDALMREA